MRGATKWTKTDLPFFLRICAKNLILHSKSNFFKEQSIKNAIYEITNQILFLLIMLQMLKFIGEDMEGIRNNQYFCEVKIHGNERCHKQSSAASVFDSYIT